VAGFLTDAWIDELRAAARSAAVPADVRLVVQQVVPDGLDGREVAYVLELADGGLTVWAGRVADPDLTFTQDRATALAIHRGELSAQVAFMEGDLRLGGDLRSVIDQAGVLAAIGDVLAAARA